ncbi:MAG: phenylacetic acid degradation protein [Burkholderiales bacterium RIFCSPLOWO2_02_FULL_57_36]|nr:MAG: phenylacetic acid degradation protein [Burkholderiales bacterium RIFCSPLOWO2_02_FULL_57_36]
MNALPNALEYLQNISRTSLFNEWTGLEVTRAANGEVELRLPWKEELGQYSGFLHAGLIGTLIDTVCGFTAAAATGKRLLASHYSVNCLSPAIGDVFLARGKVVKAGKRQIFTTAEVFAEKDGVRKLVATGETILMTAVE